MTSLGETILNEGAEGLRTGFDTKRALIDHIDAELGEHRLKLTKFSLVVGSKHQRLFHPHLPLLNLTQTQHAAAS